MFNKYENATEIEFISNCFFTQLRFIFGFNFRVSVDKIARNLVIINLAVI